MTLLRYQPPTSPFLEVLYHDQDIVVLNKPSGLLSVPGKAPAHRDSSWWRASRVWPDIRVVHRLDMATSGLLIMAQHKQAQAHLQRQFERRTVAKTYRAIIWGEPTNQSGHIDLPVRCDWPNRPRQMVDLELGKPAQTRYQVVTRHSIHNHPISEVILHPLTGRSHQLRVHMQALNTPIVGDKFYAPDRAYKAASRLLLHAEKISFNHPQSDQLVQFESPTPFNVSSVENL